MFVGENAEEDSLLCVFVCLRWCVAMTLFPNNTAIYFNFFLQSHNSFETENHSKKNLMRRNREKKKKKKKIIIIFL